MKKKLVPFLLVLTLLLSLTCLTAYAASYAIEVISGKALNAAGEVVTSSEQGKEITLVADAAPEGMVFDCWVRHSGKLDDLDTKSSVATFTMISRKIKVEASYTKGSATDGPVSHSDPNAKVKVSFLPGEGSGTMDPMEIPVNTSFSMPNSGFTAPAGKVFAGWLFADRVYPAGSAYTPTGNSVSAGITFTAIWSTSGNGAFTLVFDMNGHGTQIAAQSLAVGETPREPVDPAANGYAFGGWYTGNGFISLFDFSKPLTADSTAYARWVDNSKSTVYTLTFNMGGLGKQISTQRVVAGEAPRVPTAPTEEGYTFEGWYTSSACITPFDFSKSLSGDSAVYAKWQEKPKETCTLTFDMGGHGTQIDAQKVALGETPTEPETPTAEGFSFGGWFTDVDYATPFSFSDALLTNAVAYANWVDPGMAPPTGDDSHIILWVILASVAAGGLGVLMIVMSKKKEK